MTIFSTSATADFTKLHNIYDVSSVIIALRVSSNISSIVFITLSIAVGGDCF